MREARSLEVLFEDQWLAVVAKPSGLLSVGFPGFRGKTAENVLSDMKKNRAKIRVSAVHRLDRDTSGVMMFALSPEAKERIMNTWQEMVSERTYRCACARLPGAEPLADSGTIDAPLAYNRNDVAYVPRKNDAKALKEAERAVTHFRVIERGARYDLVECELETGRKNQIRAHMAHLGHPVVGDEVYGVERDAAASDSNPIGRLALHARVLAFTHPYTGDTLRFEVPEPPSFARLVEGDTSRKSTAAHHQDKKREFRARETSKNDGANSGRKAGKNRESDAGTEWEKPANGGKSPRRAAPTRRKERSVEDIAGDLRSLERKSRTRQDTGKSKFIPGR